MTSYGSDFTGGQTYTQSNYYSPFYGSLAFDNNTGTNWYVYTSFPEWVKIQLGAAKKAAKLRMYNGTTAESPKSFTLQGSNTGAFTGEQTTLLTVSNYTWSGAGVWAEWEFSNDTNYSYYRIYVTANGGGAALRLNEIEMMEALVTELYPEAGDDIGISESIDVYLSFSGEIPEIGENLTISESISVLLPYVGIPPIADSIGISESISTELETPNEASKSDQIAVIENITVRTNLAFDVSDLSVISESIEIALDIPPEWVSLANQGLAIERYYFTLTGEADGTTDIEIPITSFQARKREGQSTYLSVIIDDFDEYSADIANRANGEMIIEMAYNYQGETSIRQEILRADLENINLYEGPLNRSINLTGHKSASPYNRSVNLENAIYRSSENGVRLFRFAKCDPYLNPGDTVIVGDDSFVIDYIVYIVSENYKSMEVKEIS